MATIPLPLPCIRRVQATKRPKHILLHLTPSPCSTRRTSPPLVVLTVAHCRAFTTLLSRAAPFGPHPRPCRLFVPLLGVCCVSADPRESLDRSMHDSSQSVRRNPVPSTCHSPRWCPDSPDETVGARHSLLNCLLTQPGIDQCKSLGVSHRTTSALFRYELFYGQTKFHFCRPICSNRIHGNNRLMEVA